MIFCLFKNIINSFLVFLNDWKYVIFALLTSTVINAIKISIEKEYSNLSDFFLDIFHPITYKLRTFTLALTSPFQ